MKVEYNPEVSLGALLQIGTVVSAVFAAYVALSVTDAKHDGVLAQHTTEINRIQLQVDHIQTEIREQVKDVSKDIKGVDQKVTQILIERAQVQDELTNYRSRRVQ